MPVRIQVAVVFNFVPDKCFRAKNLVNEDKRKSPAPIEAFFKACILSLDDEDKMKALKAAFLPMLQAQGYTLDGVRLSDKKSIGLVKVFPPGSTTHYDSENHTDLLKLKEGQTPNCNHYDDCATLEIHVFVTGVLLIGAQSPFFLKDSGGGKGLGVPHPLWPGEHTPFDTSLFVSSKKQKLEEDVEEETATKVEPFRLNPFFRLMVSLLVAIFSRDSHHHIFKKSPRTHDFTAAEKKLNKIYTDYGMCKNDNYIFDRVRKVLLSMPNSRWYQIWLRKDHCWIYIPSWSVVIITGHFGLTNISELESVTVMQLARVDGLQLDVDYFLDTKQIVAYVFEYSPCRRETRPPLSQSSNLTIEQYVRAAVQIRNRLLYYLCKMIKDERQRVAEIVAAHNADPPFVNPVAAGPDQRSRRSSTSSDRTSTSSSSSTGTNAMEATGRRQSSSSTGSSSSSSSSSSSAGKRKRGE